MSSLISRIGPHVYVKGSLEAIKLYKEAFGLEERGRPALDNDGNVYYQMLAKNDEFFIGISEDKYLQDALRNDDTDEARLNMVFTVAFESEDDLRRAFDMLYEDGNPTTGLIIQPDADTYCDLVDKFGVCWCLFVPTNWNIKAVPQ